MGEVRGHPPVKLIMGMIAADEGLFPSAEAVLCQKFGSVDFRSDVMPFDYTKYYAREMGTDLMRRFITFEELIQPAQIVEIKLFTNDLEREFLHPDTDGRRINLDPGYITAAKLVLVSTKDHIHRIYLRDGVYAEVTLRMEKGTFRSWSWTYPDYSSEGYIKIFNEIRQTYMKQLRDSGLSPHLIQCLTR